MSVILFANVGNSDLTIDDQRPRNPRHEGKEAFEQFDAHTFTLEIIEPCVQEILREHRVIDQVVLFYTDQRETPESTRVDRFGVALRDKDTLWFARIIGRVLEQRFGKQVGSVDLVPLQRNDGQQVNPSTPDEAFDLFGQLMPRWYDPGVDHAYVLMAGGLPACNSALQLHALTCYGERCAMLYKAEKDDPYEQRMGIQLQQVFQRNAALQALERQNYAAALALVESAVAPDLLALLRFATYRESFDFARAQSALRDAMRHSSGDVRSLIGELRAEMDALERREMPALLCELVLNAGIAFANERYADFLGRLFRFQEATLRFVVEQYLGIPTDISTEYERFARAVEQHSALVEFLRARTINNRPLRYEAPTIPALGAMLEFMLQGGIRADGTVALDKRLQGVFTGLKKALDSIEHLSKLRNQSVIAHGFAGVSRDALADACSGDAMTPLKAMQKALGLLNLPQQDAMVRLSEYLRERLRRGEAR